MIGVNVNAAKSMFFDRVLVESAVNRATIKALSKMGAFIRTSARSSIRKRKKPSKPGQAPSSHTGLLKKFIFFGYQAQTGSVVVGPAKLNGTLAPESLETLEFGGTAEIRGRRETREVPIEARPYMGPAMTKNLPKFPTLWANQVR